MTVLLERTAAHGRSDDRAPSQALRTHARGARVAAPAPRVARDSRTSDRQRPTGHRTGTCDSAQWSGRTHIEQRRANRGSVRSVLVTAVLTLLVVGGLLGIAHLRAGEPAAAPAAGDVVAVTVLSGESLAELAERVSPDVPVGRTVARIGEINGYGDITASSSLPAGSIVLVPAYGADPAAER